MEKKNNNKFIIVLIGIIGVCLIALGITYAYWILTRQQNGENVVNTACLNITFTGENDITLDKAYPFKPDELSKFLSTATPYHFTITNECSDLASASINLESLNVTGKALEDDYIDVILYEDNYNTNLNSSKELTGNTLNDENKVIKDAKHSYSLYNFTLKAGEEKDFNLLLYINTNTPMTDANMNASWDGKITLSAGYQEENKTIRTISYFDNKGMWGYKDKLTRIVVEDTKNVKQTPESGKVYGPFDESADGYGGVQSYVVCEANDENCIGYLQSNGKVKANSDSSNLFYGFTNVTEIDLSKLDTSNVTKMKSMFQLDYNLQTINFGDYFDTSHVIDMSIMFQNTRNLQELDLSHFDTRNVTSMYEMFGYTGVSNLEFPNTFDTSNVEDMGGMFRNLQNIESLDLSKFDTSKVTVFESMFKSSTKLQTIIFGPKFIHKEDARAEDMYAGCLSSDRPSDDSWNGVCYSYGSC